MSQKQEETKQQEQMVKIKEYEVSIEQMKIEGKRVGLGFQSVSSIDCLPPRLMVSRGGSTWRWRQSRTGRKLSSRTSLPGRGRISILGKVLLYT